MLFVGGSNLGWYFTFHPQTTVKTPLNIGLWLVCGPCGRVVVASNNRIVLAQKAVKVQKLLVHADKSCQRMLDSQRLLNTPKVAKKWPSIIGNGVV